MGRRISHFKRLFSQIRVSREQARQLATAAGHSPYLKRHRAAMLIDRVQLVAAAFGVLTPLWIVVDAVAFPWPAWGVLAVVRLVSSLVFLALAWPTEAERTPRRAFTMLAALLVAPPVFYLVSLPLFAGLAMTGLAAVVGNLYGLLPFVVVAGLGVFPLTLAEGLMVAVPVFVLTAYGAAQAVEFAWAAYIGNLWLLMLIVGASLFASLSQLLYMIALVSRASQDPLTGVFTRRSGSEIMDLEFRMSVRQDTPLTVAFFDLDNFKSINDTYGHDEGDNALRTLVATLREQLRRADVVIRWGGEEFVVVLADTDCAGARLVIRRIMERWLGERPDGGPLTASIGVAERRADRVADWPDLVELADKRMYAAKKGGKKRCVSCGDEVLA